MAWASCQCHLACEAEAVSFVSDDQMDLLMFRQVKRIKRLQHPIFKDGIDG